MNGSSLEINIDDESFCGPTADGAGHRLSLQVAAPADGGFAPGTYSVDAGQVTGSLVVLTEPGGGGFDEVYVTGGAVVIATAADGGSVEETFGGEVSLWNVSGSFNLVLSDPNGCNVVPAAASFATQCGSSG
jgi:hypothetical protein